MVAIDCINNEDILGCLGVTDIMWLILPPKPGSHSNQEMIEIGTNSLAFDCWYAIKMCWQLASYCTNRSTYTGVIRIMLHVQVHTCICGSEWTYGPLMLSCHFHC